MRTASMLWPLYVKAGMRRENLIRGKLRGICYTVVSFLTAALPASRIRSELLASPAFRPRAFRSSLPSDFIASLEMQE